jgi:hypothetical protein
MEEDAAEGHHHQAEMVTHMSFSETQQSSILALFGVHRWCIFLINFFKSPSNKHFHIIYRDHKFYFLTGMKHCS